MTAHYKAIVCLIDDPSIALDARHLDSEGAVRDAVEWHVKVHGERHRPYLGIVDCWCCHGIRYGRSWIRYGRSWSRAELEAAVGEIRMLAPSERG